MKSGGREGVQDHLPWREEGAGPLGLLPVSWFLMLKREI